MASLTLTVTIATLAREPSGPRVPLPEQSDQKILPLTRGTTCRLWKSSLMVSIASPATTFSLASSPRDSTLKSSA